MKTTTITALIKTKCTPQLRPIVQKVITYCDKMKFGALIKSRHLEEELQLSEYALNAGKVLAQLREYRYKTREPGLNGLSIWVAYYGSRKTIKTLLSKLAELEGN